MIDFFVGIGAWFGAFFIFGTIWFWMVSVAFFGLMIFWTEDDSNFFAGIGLAAFVWTMSTVNDFSIMANPLTWAKWVGVYFLVGTIWSFIKWFSYLHKVKDELREHKKNYLQKTHVGLQDNGQFFDNDFAGFATYLHEKRYGSFLIKTRADVIPSMSDEFSDLVRWIVWWPFSAFWTILNDPIRRVAEFIVNRFSKIYENIASSVFKNEV